MRNNRGRLEKSVSWYVDPLKWLRLEKSGSWISLNASNAIQCNLVIVTTVIMTSACLING